MNLYDIGRVCVKTMGRETGSYCVVVEKKDDNYVVVTGPKSLTGVRRRNCNIRHLEPLELTVQIKGGASDEVVMKALEQAGLVERFRNRVRF
jgi:large subunit ribosomal protein L14e